MQSLKKYSLKSSITIQWKQKDSEEQSQEVHDPPLLNTQEELLPNLGWYVLSHCPPNKTEQVESIESVI